MDSTAIAILVLALCGLAILVVTVVFLFTIWEAAREAAEYFRRENDRHRRDTEFRP